MPDEFFVGQIVRLTSVPFRIGTCVEVQPGDEFRITAIYASRASKHTVKKRFVLSGVTNPGVLLELGEWAIRESVAAVCDPAKQSLLWRKLNGYK